jgi:predicted Zn-dependent protease
MNSSHGSFFLGICQKGICAILIFVLVCFSGSKAFSLSIEEEKIMGRKFVNQARKYFDLVNNEFCRQYINDLGHYLIIPLESRPFPFDFYIIKDNTLNAFAAPGGHVFIFSGLINAVDSLDELASVICHEIGHVSARHISQRMEQSKKMGMATLSALLLGVFIGGDTGSALITGTMAAGVQAQLSYSRDNERQSDQIGFKLLSLSGFDAHATIEVMKKLGRASLFGTNKIPAYLLTHPTGPERISNLHSLLSNYKQAPLSKEAAQFKKIFPYFKTIIVAKSLKAVEAKKRFELEKTNDPESSMPDLGLGIVNMQLAEYDIAISYLKQAQKKKPDFVPILTTLAQAYEINGQNREAIKLLEDVLDLEISDDSVTFLLGVAYENIGEYGKALDLFKKLVLFQPVRNDVYYHLGIVYGRQASLGRAHYNFGLYFKSIDEIKKAQFHFKKAASFAKDNPKLQVKIRKQQNSLFKGEPQPQKKPHHVKDRHEDGKQTLIALIS